MNGVMLRRIFTIERRSGGIDFGTSIFLAISRNIAALHNIDRRSRRAHGFEAAQQALLVALDLKDRVIAGLAGDLKGFFDGA